jgi:exosortase N
MKTEFLLTIGNHPWLSRFKPHFSKSINVLLMLYIGIAITGGFFAFPLSFMTKNNVLIGFALFPFVLFYSKKQRFNYLYLTILIFFEILAYLHHIRIFYFFALAFFVLFIAELWIGKVNTLVLFLLAFMSPVFQQAAIILGFPIRLQISKLAGQLLTWAGMPLHVEGNMMMLNGSSFSVDEACMGLSMLAISMLMGVMAIAHQYHKKKTQLSLLNVSLFFLVVFLLNLLCNLLRILVLVLFNIPPENPMHEFVGILCFVIYIMIPIYFLSQWMLSRSGKPIVVEQGTIQLTYFGKSCMMILSIIILLTGIHLNESRKQVSTFHASASLQGFQSTNLNDGIIKLTNDQVLIYVKPIPEFFTSEHTPLLCWQGSGYYFESIRTTIAHGQEIYTGHLVNQKSVLYTAWWYSNGNIQTINQLDWRFRMIKGEDGFSLINVTSDNEADLNATLHLILKQKQLNLSL